MSVPPPGRVTTLWVSWRRSVPVAASVSIFHHVSLPPAATRAKRIFFASVTATTLNPGSSTVRVPAVSLAARARYCLNGTRPPWSGAVERPRTHTAITSTVENTMSSAPLMNCT